jgi:hypothetical protein
MAGIQLKFGESDISRYYHTNDVISLVMEISIALENDIRINLIILM